MAAWSLKSWKKCPFLFFFWKNDPLRGNLQNSVPKGFTASPIDMLCANFVEFREIWPTRNGKVVHYLPLKNKISPRFPARASARISPKFARANPRLCAQSAPDFIQIGSLSVKLYPNASGPSERAPKWMQYIRLKPSFEPNNYDLSRKVLISPISGWKCVFMALWWIFYRLNGEQ